MRPIEYVERTLRAAGGSLTLKEVTDETGLAAPTAYRALQQLALQRRVRKEGHAKVANYSLLPRLHIEWTAQVESSRKPWNVLEWSSDAPIDWRFPLVSRVPDRRGQETLCKFMALAMQRGLLTPWMDQGLLARAGGTAKRQQRRDAYFRRLADQRVRDALRFVVFGSSARGEARSDSDLDLLILGPDQGSDTAPWFIDEIGFTDLAGDINLGASRPLQVQMYPENHFRDEVPANFRHAVRREGITIYSTKAPLELEESKDG